ncbi:ABC transporter substrate-binding protein [Cohnella phaseoli]|uniref:Putative aldouronate transport system substrate-binding protein n=1 Tax=Cohnella phaseoli TaxID=456490 RepID=A0A3D9IRL4_9BACL|nr:ABC transporter substrate-binding protein [Cohnella phaseoli]RED64420.1 putative aldouronate transport system substrate-binding protein [Cohnella phaseoli]
MNKGYKKTSVWLSIVVLLTLLVSACSSNGNAGKQEGQSGESPAATGTSTQEAPSETASGESLEPVTLKWLVPKTFNMNKADEVFAAINKITQEKINATIDFTLVELGEYDQKVSMMLAANESFDIAFTSNWINPYIPNVAKGAYAALDDILEKYAPQTIAGTNAAVWDAIKVDGKIYATPIQQIYARQFGLMFKKELLDKYKFDYTNVKKLEDLEPYLQQIKENEPDLFPIEGVGSNIWENGLNYFGFDALVGTRTPGAVKSFGDLKAVNQYESQEFKDYVELMRSWYQKGYIQKDAATTTTNYRSQGKYAIVTDPVTKPGGDVEFSSSQAGGIPYVAHGMGDRPLTTGSIQASMNAINKNSQHPERALMFIDLLNSDPEILNLVVFGLEGLSYTKSADGKVTQKMDGAYDGVYNFFVGNVFNTFYTEGQPDGMWEETAKINMEAKPSVALGFVFNSDPVSNELAKAQAVIDQYLKALASGSVDVDKVLPEFIQKLKNAGSEAIIAELQKQLDAWAAKK